MTPRSSAETQAALALAAANATLLLLPHNPTKGKSAADNISRATGNFDVTVIILDLSELSSVRTAAAAVLETSGLAYVHLAAGPSHAKGHVQRELAYDLIRRRRLRGGGSNVAPAL